MLGRGVGLLLEHFGGSNALGVAEGDAVADGENDADAEAELKPILGLMKMLLLELIMKLTVLVFMIMRLAP